MLILGESQVEPCRVIKPDAGKLKALPGVVYQNKLFRRLKQFPGPDNATAVNLARQVYNKTSGQNLVLVVEEEIIHSVWCEDRSLKRSNAPNGPQDFIQQLELEKVVMQMRNIGGVAIKDRRYNLKSYPRCFVGKEASAWFAETFDLSSEDAVRLGQRLIDERWIYHVAQEHGFKDAELFYRFFWDDK